MTAPQVSTAASVAELLQLSLIRFSIGFRLYRTYPEGVRVGMVTKCLAVCVQGFLE